MRLLLSSLVLFSGCDETFYDDPPVDDVPEVPSPKPPRVTNSLKPYINCSELICPIAAGGTNVFTVFSGDAATVDVVVGTGPATVTPYLAQQREYLITTTADAGATSLSLVSDEFEPAEYEIITKLVRVVEMNPGTPYRRSTTGTLAYTDASREVVFALRGPDITVSNLDLLVDGSLAVTTADATRITWDRYKLPTGPGTRTIDLVAESFGTRSFTVDIVDGIDRIESLVEGTPGVNKPMTVCFFAFNGDREVVVPFSITKPAGALATGSNCVTNFYATAPGRFAFTATALGVTGTAEVVVE